ncbi:MAG: hypothetical protein J0I06_00315 [Planctomycetes bacterium]|nr:hypothetical protein [Planctomycetota bacterium]
MKSVRLALLIVLIAVGAVGADAIDRARAARKPTEAEVRQALIWTTAQSWGAGTYMVEELETEPLVVYHDREGNPVWKIGRWWIYPGSLRYKYVPTGPRERHLETGGYFALSWFRGWEAVTDRWVSVCYPPENK